MPVLSTIDREKLREALLDPETPATVILVIVIDLYGAESFDWDVETLEMELQADLVRPVTVNLDKLHGLITLLTTDEFYNDWLTFSHIANALNDDQVLPGTIDPPTPEEAAWAITEASLLEAPDSRPEYSDELRRFLGVLCEQGGITRPPDVLRLAILPETEDSLTSEDPILYHGVYKRQESDSQAITEYVRERLLNLVKALDRTPLQNRDTESWEKFRTAAQKKLGRLSRESVAS